MTRNQIKLVTIFSGYLLLAIAVYRWQIFTHYIFTIYLFKILVPAAFILLFLGVGRLLKLPYVLCLAFPLALEATSYLYIRHAIKANQNAARHEVGVLNQWVNYRDVVQFNREFASYSPDLGYVLRPNSSGMHNDLEYENEFRINSFGLRDDDASLNNPRIVFLGDSFTMGWGVDQDQTYANLVEQKLGVKALNAGISSYGTFREMLLFSKIKRDSCKLVVLQYCDNDREENEARNEPNSQGQLLTAEKFRNTAIFNRINEGYYPMRYTYFFVREKDLLKRVWASPLLVTREIAMAISSWIDGTPLPVHTPQDIKTPAETKAHTEYFFKSLAKIRQYYKGNIVVMHLDGRYTRPEMIRAFETYGKREEDDKLFFLPTHQILRAKDYYPIDGHINAAGHARISEALVTLIREKELLTR
jgi:lysophospholipase L1-like esterase